MTCTRSSLTTACGGLKNSTFLRSRPARAGVEAGDGAGFAAFFFVDAGAFAAAFFAVEGGGATAAAATAGEAAGAAAGAGEGAATCSAGASATGSSSAIMKGERGKEEEGEKEKVLRKQHSLNSHFPFRRRLPTAHSITSLFFCLSLFLSLSLQCKNHERRCGREEKGHPSRGRKRRAPHLERAGIRGEGGAAGRGGEDFVWSDWKRRRRRRQKRRPPLELTPLSFNTAFSLPKTSKQDALAAEESKADARKRKRIGEIDLISE